MKRWISALIAGGFISLGLYGAALAGVYEDGQKAYEQGDYATALQLWRPLAEQGDARSQHMLGLAYGLGHGVPRDYATAVRWYRLAADQGMVAAAADLGAMYANGDGVPQDYAEALKWWRRAVN